MKKFVLVLAAVRKVWLTHLPSGRTLLSLFRFLTFSFACPLLKGHSFASKGEEKESEEPGAQCLTRLDIDRLFEVLTLWDENFAT